MFTINKIKVTGDNNVVLQDMEGNTHQVILSDFIKTYTREKDERIEELQTSLRDKAALQQFSERELQQIGLQVIQLQQEKTVLENKVTGLLQELSGKDFSVDNELYQKAVSLFLAGDITAAIATLDDATLDRQQEKLLAAEQEIEKQKMQLAENFYLKGQMLFLEEEYEGSIIQVKKAINLVGNVSGYWYALGMSELANGEYKKALDSFYTAQKFLAVNDTIGAGNCLEGIGRAHYMLGDYPLSIDYFLQGIEQFNKGNSYEHLRLLSIAYNETALAYGELDNKKEKLDYTTKALEIATQIKLDDYYLSYILSNMGHAHYVLEDFETALTYFFRTLNLRGENASYLADGNIYFNIGCAKNYLGHEDFLQWMKKAINIDKERFGENYWRLARYYVVMTDLFVETDKMLALGFCNDAERILKLRYEFPHPEFLECYNGLGTIHQGLKNYPESISYFKKAIEIKIKFPYKEPGELGKYYVTMGVSQFGAKDYEAAITSLKKGSAIMQQYHHKLDVFPPDLVASLIATAKKHL